MVSQFELVLLGALAGFTIYLGLPVALFGVSERVKGFLTAVSIGILMFLIVDVFSHAWDVTSDAAKDALRGVAGSSSEAWMFMAAMFGGLALGLLGLLLYERTYMGKGPGKDSSLKISMMIALGIGAHNLSEGLAIGQSYAGGAIGLALVLVVGFAVHNATEGFGIAAPLSGMASKAKGGFLAKVFFIGGAPTFIGTIVGSVSFSASAYVFFLALAGGALVYVTMLMFNTGRKQYGNGLMMAGIFLGLCAGFLTDLVVIIGGL